MDATKIRLSEEEVSLARNAEIILTKNAIMKKMQALLEGLQSQHDILLTEMDFLPQEVLRNSPKISRGENYLGLPYLVLDQPRSFEINNIFAIRTLFWWGRSFIVTLHLSGRHKETFEKRLLDSFGILSDRHYYLCINEDQWKHHLEPDNYVILKDASREEMENIVASKPFLKLARKIELGDINEAPRDIHEVFKEVLYLLRGNSEN